MAIGREALSELGKRMPQIALAILAARQGGLPAVAAFQGGVFEAEQRQAELARQAQLDEERRQAQAAQEARAQSAEQRAIEAARRAEVSFGRQAVLEGQDRLDRFQTQIGETAYDPVSAENALLGRAAALEGTLGIPQGQLSGFIPNMAPVVGRGVRADARQLLNDARAQAAKVEGGEVSDPSTSFQWQLASPRLQSYLRQTGHADGDPFKPSQLEAITGKIDIAPTSGGLTYGELFPAARNTAQGSIPVPMDGAKVDLNQASNVAVRMGWVSDRTDARQTRETAIQALRDRLLYTMRNPTSAGSGASAIARQFTALGVNADVEIDKAARVVEKEHIDRARSLDLIGPNAEIPTADQLRRGFTFATDPAARGRAIENIRGVLPGPVGTRQPVPDAVYDFVPGQGLVPAR